MTECQITPILNLEEANLVLSALRTGDEGDKAASVEIMEKAIAAAFKASSPVEMWENIGSMTSD